MEAEVVEDVRHDTEEEEEEGDEVVLSSRVPSATPYSYSDGFASDEADIRRSHTASAAAPSGLSSRRGHSHIRRGVGREGGGTGRGVVLPTVGESAAPHSSSSEERDGGRMLSGPDEGVGRGGERDPAVPDLGPTSSTATTPGATGTPPVAPAVAPAVAAGAAVGGSSIATGQAAVRARGWRSSSRHHRAAGSLASRRLETAVEVDDTGDDDDDDGNYGENDGNSILSPRQAAMRHRQHSVGSHHQHHHNHHSHVHHHRHEQHTQLHEEGWQQQQQHDQVMQDDAQEGPHQQRQTTHVERGRASGDSAGGEPAPPGLFVQPPLPMPGATCGPASVAAAAAREAGATAVAAVAAVATATAGSSAHPATGAAEHFSASSSLVSGAGPDDRIYTSSSDTDAAGRPPGWGRGAAAHPGQADSAAVRDWLRRGRALNSMFPPEPHEPAAARPSDSATAAGAAAGVAAAAGGAAAATVAAPGAAEGAVGLGDGEEAGGYSPDEEESVHKERRKGKGSRVRRKPLASVGEFPRRGGDARSDNDDDESD